MTSAAALEACCPTPAAGSARLSVAQLARSVGIKPDTIRYYEEAGLLPPAQRTAAEHRRYDDTAVGRPRFIQGAQRLGLRLREIKTPARGPRHRHLSLRPRRGPAPRARRRPQPRAGPPERPARRTGPHARRAPHRLPRTRTRHLASRKEVTHGDRPRVLLLLRLRQLRQLLLQHRLLLNPRPPSGPRRGPCAAPQGDPLAVVMHTIDDPGIHCVRADCLSGMTQSGCLARGQDRPLSPVPVPRDEL